MPGSALVSVEECVGLIGLCILGRDSGDSGTLGPGGQGGPTFSPPPFFSAVVSCGSEADAWELQQLVGGMQAAAVLHVRFVGHGLLVMPPAATPVAHCSPPGARC